MNSLQTTISFEAAHRLYDVATYSEECRENIHGHSYKVKVEIGRMWLDDSGMVMDFKKLKSILKDTIESKYDHSCILRVSDPLCKPILDNCKKVILVDDNPTAEWMARSFANAIELELQKVDKYIVVLSVAVQETENNIAVWTRG